VNNRALIPGWEKNFSHQLEISEVREKQWKM
jgi:hypothetical protein